MSDATGTKNYSQQPRFGRTEADDTGFFMSIYNWVQDADMKDRPYVRDSRVRDKWLRDFVRKEPHLMGVLNTVVDIDKNRGWRMVGGRNQVIRFTDMMHSFQVAPGICGWRPAISFLSSAYWGSDIGAVAELGRDGRDGPVRQLYVVDPVKCALTGKDDYPLSYFPTGGKRQKWRREDFFRVSSMLSTDEDYAGLGYCAVSRSLEFSRMMVGLITHNKEQMGAQAPRGLMLLQGISQSQWNKAMDAQEAETEGKGYKYFGQIAVLASSATTVDAKLIALSQLPTAFNLKDWVDWVMYGYALCFSYDPSEFWVVQYGALGRGNETQIQHEKATGKGRLDFVLGFQEQLQIYLPASLEFLFDQRDEQGDLLNASVNQSWSNVAKTLYEAGKDTNEGPLLNRAEARTVLAEHGVIPRSWQPNDEDQSTDQTDPEEDVDVVDAGKGEDVDSEAEVEGKELPDTTVVAAYKKELRSSAALQRAAIMFPDEPIVQYTYPSNTMHILWKNGYSFLEKPVAIPVRKAKVAVPLTLPAIVPISEGDDVSQILRDSKGKIVGAIKNGRRFFVLRDENGRIEKVGEYV